MSRNLNDKLKMHSELLESKLTSSINDDCWDVSEITWRIPHLIEFEGYLGIYENLKRLDFK